MEKHTKGNEMTVATKFDLEAVQDACNEAAMAARTAAKEALQKFLTSFAFDLIIHTSTTH